MLSILLVDTVGEELHPLLFASFADGSTPTPKNYNSNQRKQIYLQCLDLRHTCTKGFDPGVWQICQQHLFSPPIICLLLIMKLIKKNWTEVCKTNYKLTFRSLEAMDWVPLRWAWTAEYIRSWKQFSSNTLKWHRITLTLLLHSCTLCMWQQCTIC